MADNPFLAQLQQLDGIVFGTHSLFSIIGTDPGSNPMIMSGSNQNSLSLYYADDRYSVPNPNKSLGALKVSSFNYVAGYIYPDTDFYVPPNFGAIEFPNSTFYSLSRFYIRGFSSDGSLLLTKTALTALVGPGSIEDSGGNFLRTTPFTADSFPITFEANAAVFCFAEGTRIETADGPVAVEDLTEGMLALTASGTRRPIRWIGQLVSRPARHKRPWEVNPVRILPHAFGPNIPAREVRLSPGHSVFVDGVLVPVAHLVNGATIVQDDVEAIRYFHVELDSHDVLLAEGLPCESYLNDRGRQGFVNAGEVPQLHARLDPQSWDDACAPLVVEGPQLTAIRARLHAQAEALGWSLSDAVDVMLEVDGATLLPRMVQDGTWTFDVPAAKTVRLVSNAGVLAHVRPDMADRRMLGVAVTALAVAGQSVDLEDAVFGTGFHAVERQEQTAWRWSDGYATLDLALSERTTLAVTVSIAAPAWSRVPTELKRVA